MENLIPRWTVWVTISSDRDLAMQLNALPTLQTPLTSTQRLMVVTGNTPEGGKRQRTCTSMPEEQASMKGMSLTEKLSGLITPTRLGMSPGGLLILEIIMSATTATEVEKDIGATAPQQCAETGAVRG